MHKTEIYDAVIIGGGFFGLSIAHYCRRELGVGKVLVLEKEADVMQRASYNNQARVHGGYHYPRSLLTGLRSQVNFDRFVAEYSDAIVNDFDKYYAVAKSYSKVSAQQFRLFCERITAPIEPAPQWVKKLFNKYLIEDVFKVREYAFDAVLLKKKLLNNLAAVGIEVRMGETAHNVSAAGDHLRLETVSGRAIEAKRIFNCAYSMINKLNSASNLEPIALKHELAEMCLVTLPPTLANMSVTVMCGPFFSFMPFPARGLHTLSHVRYTPHSEWHDTADNQRDGHRYLADEVTPVSHFAHMFKDAVRYMPALRDIEYKDSLWEVKTVLARSEYDDSRPILFRNDHGLKGYSCVMGAKLDNIYDVFRELDTIYA